MSSKHEKNGAQEIQHPSIGTLLLRWMSDEDRSPGYLATRSAINVERLVDLLAGAAAATSFEITALAAATGFTETQLQEAYVGQDGPDDQPSRPDPLQCLTIKDVAHLLQVGQDTVRSAIDAGSLPSFVVGQRSIRILRLALEQHLLQVGGAA